MPDSSLARRILWTLLSIVLIGWATFGYLALLMTIFGIGRGGLAFGITLAIIGLWALLERGLRPWWFRLTQAEKFARKHDWTCSKEYRKTGRDTAINLRIEGEYQGRRFSAEQISTDTSSGDPASSTGYLSTVVWLAVPTPLDSVEFRRLTGRSAAPAEFARWLRRHRLLGRSLRYADGGVTAEWRGGMYRGRLLRRLRFLAEADGRLRG